MFAIARRGFEMQICDLDVWASYLDLSPEVARRGGRTPPLPLVARPVPFLILIDEMFASTTKLLCHQ